jgi:DNA primase
MIQKIKSRLSCTEYLSRHGIHVKNGGRTVSPLRPGARNPTSFWVEDDHWYDFGSAMGGDVIDLAAQLQYNGDLSQAVHGLADELGLQFSDYSETYRADIQNLCNRTAAYHAALTPSDYEYLAARGFTPEDASRLMIGRVTDGYLKGRLFLPYFKNGAVVYYATRAMPDSSFQENKYMKASRDESPSYQHIPWGLQTLNRRTNGHDTLIISEGYFDAVSWEREGYPVISPITGNFSKDQWPDVIAACRMFSKVLIIFDNDAVSHAGEGFTARTARKLFQNRIPFLVGHTPHGIKDDKL